MGAMDELCYRVEQWDETGQRVEEIVAAAADLLVARAAYEATVKRRPGQFILLRHKARIINQSRQ